MAERILEGVLVIDKAKGPTSHDVVAMLRRILNLRRIGHCGTLDPLASGVLVTCLGRFTRLNRWLSATDKEYEATIYLGATSPTGDAQGPIAPQRDCTPPSYLAIERELESFKGEIEQVPPAFSAVKVGGERSYKRARRGEIVELKSRRVWIHTLDLVRYDFPHLVVKIRCSSGTYIRSLAVDLGQALQTGAYLSDLRRLRVGRLGLDQALTLDQVATRYDAGDIDLAFAKPRQALGELSVVELSPESLTDFTHGKAIESSPLPVLKEGDCAVFDSGETLFGIARCEKGALRPYCVLRQPETQQT